MSKAKHIPEEILASIQNLPQDSLDELTDFIEYLQYKNSLRKNKDNQNIQESKNNRKAKITVEESEEIIEEILIEVGDSILSLSDYAVGRDDLYSN